MNQSNFTYPELLQLAQEYNVKPPNKPKPIYFTPADSRIELMLRILKVLEGHNTISAVVNSIMLLALPPLLRKSIEYKEQMQRAFATGTSFSARHTEHNLDSVENTQVRRLPPVHEFPSGRSQPTLDVPSPAPVTRKPLSIPTFRARNKA
ncbi:hypothetical protein V6O07_21515 [Arthrospira platensis SPKY2]